MTFSEFIGVRIVEATRERAIGELTLERHHYNANGALHGGAYFALSDSVAGALTRTYQGQYVTMDANIHYLQPVLDGMVKAVATPIQLSAKIMVIRVEIFCNELLVNTGTYTMYRIKER